MRLSKLGIPIFNCCERCKHALYCEDFYERNLTCQSQKIGISYKLDRKQNAENQAMRERAIKALVSTLKVTDGSQLIFHTNGKLEYKPKNDAKRIKNSRCGALKKTGRLNEWRRYCENCGKKFVTINETRRLCNGCHEEICERLGVDYSQTKMWSKRRAKKAR